jgi:hypothetical protein
MSVYTVQAPTNSLGEPEIEKSVFLREGFSWGAFVFGLLWLLMQRLWGCAALWLAIIGLLAGLTLSYLSPGSFLLIALALRIFLGLEANALLRRKLSRRRYQLVGVVTATTLENAERTFYSHAAQPKPAPEPLSKDMPPPMPHPPTQVLGVFPEPETGR